MIFLICEGAAGDVELDLRGVLAQPVFGTEIRRGSRRMQDGFSDGFVDILRYNATN